MKRLIHRLPLILGCLFLSWVLILLIEDVTKPYEQTEPVYTESNFLSEEYEYEGPFSFPKSSGAGLCYIADRFIYAYNECGYFDNELPYTGVGQITHVDAQCGFIVLFLLAALLFLVPVLAGGFTGQIYVVTGGTLALILLLGKVPKYEYLVLLIIGWIYLNLAKSWMKIKERTSPGRFLHEFPWILVPIYMVIILLFMLLSVFMPSDRLPENSEAKKMIFSRLQEIRLVSDQYEERQRLKQQSPDREEVDTETEAAEQADTDDALQKPEMEDDLQRTEGAQPQESGGEEQNVGTESSPDSDQADRSERQDTGDGWGIAGEHGLRFSLNSGGGVSAGRTDRTGNLQFSGKMVLQAVMDVRPERDLYVRLFYAENYEDNRWKRTDEEHFVDIGSLSRVADYNGDNEQDFVWKGGSEGGFSETAVRELTMPAFYSLMNGGGDSGIEAGFLELVYPDHSSDHMTFGSSKRAAEYYPEQSQYLDTVCQMVPEKIEELLLNRFSQFYQMDMESLTDEEAVEKIEKLLEETAYYTLSPGSVPVDQDFITWFLTKNKKGYCMHFASAGVMMLREAGICSRYAEGYFVPVSAWKKQEDGSWCAEILDSNAHAWAEIYQKNGSGDAYGCWVPVEVTPAYDGELAGTFAGQQDEYVGKFVIPGGVIWLLKVILRLICVLVAAVGLLLFFRKAKWWYEYRMLHTGDERQDIKNMMKLLLKKLIRKNREVRKLLKENNLTQKELTERILILVPEFCQDREAEEWFTAFSDYVYRAAFGAEMKRKDKKEAIFLYRKLRKKLDGSRNMTSKKQNRI